MGKLPLEELQPLVGSLPHCIERGEIRPGSVKRAWNDTIRDAFAGAFVAVIAREVRPRQPAERRARTLRVVGVDELDAMTLRKAMVGRIEIAPVIEHGLIDLEYTIAGSVLSSGS